MLATYFKQYPPHLVKIAQRQAESRSLPPTSPRPLLEMDESSPDESAPSDSGRTYTISDQSEEQLKQKEILPENPKKLQKSLSLDLSGKNSSPKEKSFDRKSPIKEVSPTSELIDKKSPIKEDLPPLDIRKKSPPKGGNPTAVQKPKSPIKDRPSTLDLKDKKNRVLDPKNKKSPHSPSKDGPISSLDPKKGTRSPLVNKKSPMKDRSPLSELFKSKTIPDASFSGRKSPPKTKTPVRKMADRSISLEEKVLLCQSHLTPEPEVLLYPSHVTPLPQVLVVEEEPPKSDSSSIEDVSITTCNHLSPREETDSPVQEKLKSHSLGSEPSVEPHQNGGSCPMHHPTPPQTNGGACPMQSSPPPPPKTRVRASSSSSSARSSAAESQLLHCGMCAQRFSNPKVLPCLHTFCEGCLISYTPDESLTLTCPLCRQQSILPKDGVTGLQANTWVSGIIDALDNPPIREPCCSCGQKPSVSCAQCDTNFCEDCARKHTKDSTSEDHSVISLDDVMSQSSSEHQEDTTLYCSSHAGQTLRFYCCNCETAVCTSCTAIEHQTHTTMRLSEAVDDQKMGLYRLMEKVTSQLPCVKETVSDLSSLSKTLDSKKSEAETQIRASFQTLHDVLDQRQTQLMNTLNNVVSTKKNSIEDQRHELEEWVSGVESGCEYVEKTLTDCPAMEVVLVKKQLGEKLIHYAEAVDCPPAPKENAHLQFFPGNVDPLRSAFKNIGIIQTNSAVPQQTTAFGNSLKSTVVGRQVLVTVVSRDHKGDRVKTGGGQVTATVVRCKHSHNKNINGEIHTNEECPRHANSKSEINGHVIDMKNGNYEVTFSLHHEGSYKLSILLFGQHINSSPFTIQANLSDSESCSEHGSYSGGRASFHRQTSKSTQLTRTSRTSRSKAPSHKSSNSRKTNPIEDDLIFKVGRRGRNRGEFVNPQGICYAPIKDGRIVLADSNNQCVQVFTMTGECKVKFGTRGRSVGQMQRPTGVAALPNGNYAIADYENRWVSIFEPNGKYVSRIGHGKLLGPKGLCVNAQGHLIVVDNKASCVCIFSSGGKLLTKFGNRILEGYNFAGPHFVATNSRGDIIVTDFHNHCVRVFDCEGVSLFTFGTSGEGNGQFNAPTGVAVDPNDNIIVADWGNSRIQIFDNQGSFLSFINTQVDPLYGPQGISLTDDGNVLVADSGNHCFKLYKYLQ